MTSKIVVNNIEADAGVSTVTFNSNISVGNSVTATSFHGDGSNLTGAGPTLTNGADNRVVTATGANALNAETGVVITPDSELIVGMTAGSGATPDARLQVRGDTHLKSKIQVLATHNDDNPATLQISKSRSGGNTILGNNDDIGQINFASNDGNGYHNVGRIMVTHDGSGNGNDDLPSMMRFFTTANGSASLTERMRISSEGYVTKPAHPAFDVCGSSGNPNASSGSVYITYTTVKINNGNHYSTSTGKFTVPVAGLYFFSFGCIKSGNNNLARLHLYKNGSSANDRHLRMATGQDGYGENGALTNIISCAVGDEIQVWLQEGVLHAGTAYLYFNGFLIG